MSYTGGTASFTAGTGAKSINIGSSGYTWIELIVNQPGYKPYNGFVFTSTSFQGNYSDDSTSGMDTTKAVKIRNSSGTVVIEGTFTSFSGTNVNFNLTSNVASPPQMLIKFGN